MYQNPPPWSDAQLTDDAWSLSLSNVVNIWPLWRVWPNASKPALPEYPDTFSLDYERTVLGVVPAVVLTWLEVKPQLIAAGQCQLTEQVVAKPVVASRVVEADFILRPRTVEGVRPVNVLLDQQRLAVVYRTSVRTKKSSSAWNVFLMTAILDWSRSRLSLLT